MSTQASQPAILPCPECGHDLDGCDWSENGIGTSVKIWKRGLRAKRIYAEVPGFKCPQCGHEGVL